MRLFDQRILRGSQAPKMPHLTPKLDVMGALNLVCGMVFPTFYLVLSYDVTTIFNDVIFNSVLSFAHRVSFLKLNLKMHESKWLRHKNVL